MFDCLPPMGMPCPPLIFLKFFTDLSVNWRKRENAAEDEEKVQGEVLQERLQCLNLATIAEFCISVCDSILQEMSDNAGVAFVSTVLLQHMKTCSTTLCSFTDANIRAVWVRDMCHACTYLSAAQLKSVAQRVKETIHMKTQQTFFVLMHRFVHERHDRQAMNSTLVDDIASQKY